MMALSNYEITLTEFVWKDQNKNEMPHLFRQRFEFRSRIQTMSVTA
jgi:hypothetical protein